MRGRATGSKGAAAAAPKVEQRQTERSHEENQERAYIAASRRTDRSIEARVQSARMASEIHKKRTGRGFIISEEIVTKEEMYEEEEEELPRSYRQLAAPFNSLPSGFRTKLNDYMTTHVASHTIAHQENIERLFAEQFPGAAQLSRRMSQSAYALPLQHAQDSSASAGFTSADYSAPFHHGSQFMASGQNPSATPTNLSIHTSVSPSALTPPSHSPRTQSTLGSQNWQFASWTASTNEIPLANPVFTAELPRNLQQMAYIDANDPMASALHGDAPGSESGSVDWTAYTNNSGFHFDQSMTAEDVPAQASPGGYFETSVHSNSYPPNSPGQQSRIGTPGGGAGGDRWDTWFDITSYSTGGL